MGIEAAFMVPHPPMIVPEIGRGSEKQIEETTKAYEEAAREIADIQPETILISSPHTVMYADYFHISPGASARGSFGRFGAGRVSFEETYDTELVGRICDISKREELRAGTLGERDASLDHGTMVPLFFIEKKYRDFKLVRIGLSGLPLTDHYRLGMAIQEAVEDTGRRAVYVASGDLSHKLQTYGPYGFAPEGPEYDERIMDVCSRGAFGELFDFDESFCEKAAECGHRSFVIMAGALDGVDVRAKELSHQDVTGVGYGICTFYPVGYPVDEGKNDKDLQGQEDRGRQETHACGVVKDPGREFLKQYLEKEGERLQGQRQQEDPLVRLARDAVDHYVKTGKFLAVPAWATKEMLEEQAGVFVSLHEHERLRGCIGTIVATRDNIAEEIIHNAVSACSRDPRFDPVREDELKWLDISVDVLTKPERIDSPDQLDVKRYGVIVSNGARRGLLLPDLDGVDTVEEQISIARRKGRIGEEEPVRLERFEVIRHH